MVEYADTSTEIPEQPAQTILELIENEDPMKPWDLVKEVAQDHPNYSQEDVRTDVLKPLMLKGATIINADGNVVLHDKKEFPVD